MQKLFFKGFTVAAITALLGFAAGVSADQPAALATCAACHGESGQSANPQWANLGGQHEGYLAIQLRNFRSGERKNDVMNGIAAGLSDSDIDELAAWYSAQPHITAANGKADMVEQGQNRAAYCHGCHGMKGHPVADEWPVLAGQNASYLAKQLNGFKTGARYHPLMAPVVKDLDRAAMMALGSYYSQVPTED